MEANMINENGKIDRRGNIVAANHGDHNHIIELLPSPLPSSRKTPMAIPASGAHSCRATPPPFLLKLYEMVQNPETDSIVSWSPTKKSFIIWDANKFSAQLFPMYFRHNNFASFVYQLNNYGFRKIIGVNQCEYANPWFREGKEEWLSNIRRRNQGRIMQETEFSVSSNQPKKVEMGTSKKNLKTEQNNLEQEIQRLWLQQAKLNNELAIIEDCIQAALSEQEKVLAGFIPIFIQQSVIQHLRNNHELDGAETIKNQRLLVGPESLENSGEPADKVEAIGQSVDLERETEEETIIIEPEPIPMYVTSGNVDDSAFWKKLMEDDSDCEDGGQEGETPHQSERNVQADESIKYSSTNAGENLSSF